MELGGLISEANELLARSGREGMFSSWIESECGISRRTAYNYMAAYDRLGEHTASLKNITAEAIYYLSSGSVTIDEVDAVLEEAAKNKVGLSRAKEIVQALHNSDTEPGGSTLGIYPATIDPVGDGETTPHHTPDLEVDTSLRTRDDDGEGTGDPPGDKSALAAKSIIMNIQASLTEVVWSLDQLAEVLPQERLHQAILDSIECANRDLGLWRQAIK